MNSDSMGKGVPGMAEPQISHPDPEQTSRRRFLAAVVGAFSALIALAVGIPFVAALIKSSGRNRKRSFAELASLDSLPVGTPVDLPFTEVSADAFIERESMHHVWAVRTSAAAVTVYSPICPHLGCRYDWDARLSRFMCPCHGSVYTLDGRVVSGPAPRPLDALPVEIKKGKLYVEWEQFKPGTPQKIPI
jgi:menaquinol-cytochrome c reductase iron-sulfur subunit